MASRDEQGSLKLARPRLFYGWVMVGTLGLTELVSWGVVYYAFSVILAPMQAETGWSRAQLTGAFSLALLVSGLAAVPVGRLLDRWGARQLMTAGSILAALLVLAWSRVTNLAALYLVMVGLGLAMALILYEPAFAVVSAWFERKRQRALTLLTLGGGLASVVFVPLATALEARFGWRTSLVLLALVLALVTIPLHALVLRRHPRDIGSVPDGEQRSTLFPSPAPAPRGATVHDAVRGAGFWWLALALSAAVLAAVAVNTHVIAFLTERGYSPGFRAGVAALLGGAQLPGRLLFAPLGERMPRQRLAALLLLGQVLALLLVLLLPTAAGIVLFAALFGVAAGALTPARASLVADFYGVLHYGSISGVLALLTTVARAAAPVSAGWLYTVGGGYGPVWIALLGLSLGGVLAMLRAQPPTPPDSVAA